jgi:hypothetical protein
MYVYLTYADLSSPLLSPSQFFRPSLSRIGRPSFFKLQPSEKSWTYEGIMIHNSTRMHKVKILGLYDDSIQGSSSSVYSYLRDTGGIFFFLSISIFPRFP